MSLMDHAEHVTGIASLVTIAVVAASAYVSVGAIVATIAPQWRRMLAVLLGWHLAPVATEQHRRHRTFPLKTEGDETGHLLHGI